MKATGVAGILAVGLALGTALAPDDAGAAHIVAPKASVSVSANGVTVTFSNIRQRASDEQGQVAHEVTISIHNGSKTAYSYYSIDYTALAPDAREYGSSFDPHIEVKKQLESGKLKPGKRVTGDLAFNMPSTAPFAAIRWTPSYIGSSRPINQVVVLPGGQAPHPVGPAGTYTVDQVTVTVGRARRDSSQDSQLPTGYTFQVVHITVVNHGPARIRYDYNAFDFIMLDRRAIAYGTSFFDNHARPVGAHTITPGQRLSADFAYAMLSTSKPTAIRWTPKKLGTDYPDPQIVLLPTS